MGTTSIPASQRITETDSPFFRFMRYCMSDASAHNAKHVVTGSISPIEYTKALARSEEVNLRRFFPEDARDVRRSAKVYRTAKIVDCTLEMALLQRFCEASDDDWDSATSFLVSIFPLFLSIRLDHEIFDYLGLTRPAENFENFRNQMSGRVQQHALADVSEFFTQLGNTYSDGWFLNDPLWNKALYGQPERLYAMRYFTHEVLTTLILPDSEVVEKLGIPRSVLMRDVNWFIELRTCGDASQNDVDEFVKRISDYVDDGYIVPPMTKKALFSAYGEFKIEYDNHFSMSSILMLPEWQYLKSLGKDWVCENVIDGDETPIQFAHRFVDTFVETDYDEVIVPFINLTDMNMPEDDISGYDINLIKAVLVDRLVISLVHRRLDTLCQIKSGDVPDVICSSAHILLTEVSDNPWVGMSNISMLLDYHISSNREDISSDAVILLQRLQDAWNNFDPESGPWKSVLSHVDNLRAMKNFWVHLLEILRVDPKSFDDKLQMLVDGLVPALKSDASSLSVAACVNAFKYIPTIQLPDSWLNGVWTKPFQEVKDSLPEEEIA